MLSYLQENATSLQLCWEIRRKDGVKLYYTEYDKDLVINGKIYKKRNSGISQSLRVEDALKGNESSIDMILDGDGITVADLYSFKYDDADIFISVVNPNTPDDQIKLTRGKLGKTVLKEDKAEISYKSITSLLDKNIGRIYTYTCDAELFDSYCSASTAGHIFTNKNPTGVDPTKPFTTFTDTTLNKDNGWFDNAYFKWTSGNNKDIETKVKSYTNDIITLSLAMPYEIKVADTYTVFSGCDKEFTTCKSKFNNTLNFKGFPHIPNADKMVRYE